MFDQLVQSNPHDTAKQGAYMGITALVYGVILAAVMVWSVFSFDLSSLDAGNLAFNELVAPVAMPENVPPAIVPDKPQPRAAAASKNKSNVDVIKNPVRDIKNSTDSPDKILANKSNATAVRDEVPFFIGAGEHRASFGGSETPIRGTGNIGGNASIKGAAEKINTDESAPPSTKPTNMLPTKKDVTISKGVINGSATNLPKPVYPPAARQIRAGGEVKVQVLIDERGNVVSATAVSGHALLRVAAQTAARNAKFTPTQLSNQPVKVNGVIIYNFVPQ